MPRQNGYSQSLEMAFNFFLRGHFSHGCIFPGTPNELCEPIKATAPGADAETTVGVVDRPSSQSAEHEWTRQIFASISAPGTLSPRSYLAQCWYLIPSGAAISACDCVPRSYLKRSDRTLIFRLEINLNFFYLPR